MTSSKRMNRMVVAVLAFAGAVGVCGLPASGQVADYDPPELENVGITEHLGVQVPLDLKFQDSTGREVLLRDYFKSGKPVILTLNYYSCPMLCTLQLNGLIDAMNELSWLPGEEFEIVTVSIDASESPALAKAKKESYIADYGKKEAAKGWHFLVGERDNIQTLADTVGFGFAWNAKRKEWAHAAAAFVLSPEGEVTRYLYGVQFEPKTLKLSLVEASEGKVGSTLDKIILYCYHYDPTSGKYGPVAMNIMRVGGVVTALALGTVLAMFWVREARRRKLEPSPADAEES